MSDQPWPEWAIVPISVLSRDEARGYLKTAQGFWRDFAVAGLTLAALKMVIEERRRLGPGGRITVPQRAAIRQPKTSAPVRMQTSASPDHSLFDTFPPLDPDDNRWMHA